MSDEMITKHKDTRLNVGVADVKGIKLEYYAKNTVNGEGIIKLIVAASQK
jgi:hypothetical protein